MAWFKKPKTRLQATDRRELPGDVWEKCPNCGEILYREKLRENWNVCPVCGYHMRLPAAEYVGLLLDADTVTEHDAGMRSGDPLGFVDLKPYAERLAQAERKTGQGDALIAASGEMSGVGVQLAVMNFSFIGGSMGSVVGEKIARAGLRSLENREPLIVVSASGGARMMEGIFSLMQMAKTSVVLAQLDAAGIPYVAVLTDPTTGGVTASYAMLGDVNLAEPGALIGFAGPRVIEQTIKQELPEGFQTSEFLLEHGMLDAIVDRRQMKSEISRILRHMLDLPATDGTPASAPT
ncbi:MAG TPA: acetyl-CoA carboxylase, carboxyltransferase subunit beta [Longimicrobiaceae bacterium]|jgi:acetyl-CoA carboxylase carboxyl transferase subunit beta|nr:acetyl-CoA carboxylase, carboxyltransferase subunit beta [Longimicrobiaceae bacterium]